MKSDTDALLEAIGLFHGLLMSADLRVDSRARTLVREFLERESLTRAGVSLPGSYRPAESASPALALNLEVRGGASLRSASYAAAYVASSLGVVVRFSFNERVLFALPGESGETVEDRWALAAPPTRPEGAE